MASKRDGKSFQSTWCARYGIKISARDAQTGATVLPNVCSVKHLVEMILQVLEKENELPMFNFSEVHGEQTILRNI
jgi:hypothetical protein